MSKRHITVDGVTWKWMVGRSHVMAITKKCNKKKPRTQIVIPIFKLLGLYPYDWEKDLHKGSRGEWLQVTPSKIAEWIRHHAWYQTATIDQIHVRHTAAFIAKRLP